MSHPFWSSGTVTSAPALPRIIHEPIKCTCSMQGTGFSCPSGVGGHPPQMKVVTGDILTDITGRNVSEYLLYTSDRFRLHRQEGRLGGSALQHRAGVRTRGLETPAPGCWLEPATSSSMVPPPEVGTAVAASPALPCPTGTGHSHLATSRNPSRPPSEPGLRPRCARLLCGERPRWDSAAPWGREDEWGGKGAGRDPWDCSAAVLFSKCFGRLQPWGSGQQVWPTTVSNGLFSPQP